MTKMFSLKSWSVAGSASGMRIGMLSSFRLLWVNEHHSASSRETAQCRYT